MKIVMVGDIVGSPGRKVFAQAIADLKKAGEADFVAANAENVAGGRGLTPQTAEELFAAGADVLTLGDHTWDQKEIKQYLEATQRVIRPLNFPPGCPGKGMVTLSSAWGPITVINIVGRVFMPPNDCPFRAMDAVLANKASAGKLVIVDFHAEATSEKIVMGRYLDGRVTCIAGTHTHVQTSDDTVLPGGAAYITDLGMTGPKDSAIGRDLKSITGRLLTGMPESFKVAKNDVALEGIIVDVDRETGKARQIRRLRIPYRGQLAEEKTADTGDKDA